MKKKQLLNRNEMSEPPAPGVIRAIRKFDITKAPFYLDGYYGSDLEVALARRFKIPRAQVSVGYGAEFFLRAIFDGCNSREDVVLAATPHFTFYSVYARAKHVRLEDFRLKDLGDRFEFDIEDCLKKIRMLHPKVVLITSPNNPTGNSIAPRDLQKILDVTQRETLVVLDEAYLGFNEKYDEKAIFRLLKKYENLAVLRSFSKYYALAGLRVGYALWGKRAKDIMKYDGLYLGASRLLEAVALAALGSDAYYKKLSRKFIREREKFIVAVNRLNNFKAYTSDANFVLVRVEKRAIPKLEKQLATLNVAISKFVLPEFMRVSLGSKKDMAEFLHVLRASDKNR